MIDLGVKVSKIKIEIESPADRNFWLRVGILTGETIVTRTEKRGEDVDRHKFKAYSKAYEKKRRKAELRTSPPSLSWSGRMLSAIGRGIRPYKWFRRSGVKLILSGEEGGKAYANEQRDREFFDISDKNRVDIIKAVDKELVRLNGLK